MFIVIVLLLLNSNADYCNVQKELLFTIVIELETIIGFEYNYRRSISWFSWTVIAFVVVGGKCCR